jgi:hypothetical protein
MAVAIAAAIITSIRVNPREQTKFGVEYVTIDTPFVFWSSKVTPHSFGNQRCLETDGSEPLSRATIIPLDLHNHLPCTQ